MVFVYLPISLRLVQYDQFERISEFSYLSLHYFKHYINYQVLFLTLNYYTLLNRQLFNFIFILINTTQCTLLKRFECINK